MGATKPAGKHSYHRYLPPEWRESTIAYLLGKSLLAMRVEDILVCARFLGSNEVTGTSRPVHVVSLGRTGPAALHAVALEPELFGTLTLRRSLISWSNVVRTPLAKNQFANLVHGALRTYDLPDLVGTLSAGRVKVIEPLDAAENEVHNEGK